MTSNTRVHTRVHVPPDPPPDTLFETCVKSTSNSFTRLDARWVNDSLKASIEFWTGRTTDMPNDHHEWRSVFARTRVRTTNLLTPSVYHWGYRRFEEMAKWMTLPAVDIHKFYYAHCAHRRWPRHMDLLRVKTPIIGVDIERGDGFPIYATFVLCDMNVPGVSVCTWIVSLVDEVDLLRRFLIECEKACTLVTSIDPSDVEVLEEITGVSGARMAVSDGGDDRESLFVDIMSTDMGVDVLSWQVYTDRSRLSEKVPKHPISCSFRQGWRLRPEQVAYMTLRAISPLFLLQRMEWVSG